jgi:hypothetical protein
VCSENPNSGGRKRITPQAGPERGFTQRLSFGKAVVAFRLLQPRAATRDERRMDGLFH